MLAGTWLISSTLRGASAQAPATPAEIEGAKKRWKPEPELEQSTPRRVRLNATAKIVALAWLLMFAVGGAWSYVRVFSRNPPPPSRALLDAEGARTQATVHRREVREDSGGEPRYMLYYNFAGEDGSAVRSSVTVAKPLFDLHQEGEKLETVYLPGDPLAHYLPALTRPAFAERGLLMALVVLAFFAYLLESRRRRHRRLVREGTAAPGVAENVRRRGGARVFQVRFRANGRDGLLKVTERNPMRRDGDVVTVLYDPQNPEEAELYGQCLYRAA